MNMSISDKKKYLLKYRLQQAKINRITEMLESFPEERDKFRKQLFESRQLRDRIESEIEAVGDDILEEVLSQKYLCGHSISEIALLMNYSTRQIERLHKKALECFSVS